MRLLKSLFGLVSIVGVFALVIIIQEYYLEPPEKILGGPTILDGDSLDFRGVRVRLYGIDAPEYGQRCLSFKEEIPCGQKARQELMFIIRTNPISCEVQSKDKYGRFLAICYVKDIDIGREMVKRGHAVAYGAYEAEEQEAKRDQRGIWKTHFERPEEWRKNKTTSYATDVLEKPHVPLFLQAPLGIKKELQKWNKPK